MTDLGFGLVDRRSIIAVLLTLGLSDLILGYALPVDSSNAVTAFLGLLLLTGFIYGIRSIFRLGLLLGFSVLRMPYDLKRNRRSDKQIFGLRGWILFFAGVISDTFRYSFVYPAFRVRDWQPQSRDLDRHGFSINASARKYGLLGGIDRIGLIGISVAATIPSLSEMVQLWGAIGIGILIMAYVITGNFTFVLEDAMRKAELERQRQHEELRDAASNPNISFPSVITTKPERKYD